MLYYAVIAGCFRNLLVSSPSSRPGMASRTRQERPGAAHGGKDRPAPVFWAAVLGAFLWLSRGCGQGRACPQSWSPYRVVITSLVELSDVGRASGAVSSTRNVTTHAPCLGRLWSSWLATMRTRLRKDASTSSPSSTSSFISVLSRSISRRHTSNRAAPRSTS
jgi:hypothetical protein